MKVCNQDISKALTAWSNKEEDLVKILKNVIIFYRVIALCKFWHLNLVIMISAKYLQLVALNFVS